MTSTNKIRVTFTADNFNGKGYLTENAEQNLFNMIDHFHSSDCIDILEQWKEKIDHTKDHAKAELLGFFYKGKVNDAESAAIVLWENGVWPDVFMLNDFECGAETDNDYFDDSDFLVESEEFKTKLRHKADCYVNDNIDELIEAKRLKASGKRPSFDSLVDWLIIEHLLENRAPNSKAKHFGSVLAHMNRVNSQRLD